MLFKFAGPFDSLDPKESQTQHECQRQVNHLRLPLSNLGRADCQHDGQAAADEDSGVNRTQCDVERVTGGGELREIPEAVDEIGAKHAAEEHDLGCEKQPHPQR